MFAQESQREPQMDRMEPRMDTNGHKWTGRKHEKHEKHEKNKGGGTENHE